MPVQSISAPTRNRRPLPAKGLRCNAAGTTAAAAIASLREKSLMYSLNCLCGGEKRKGVDFVSQSAVVERGWSRVGAKRTTGLRRYVQVACVQSEPVEILKWKPSCNSLLERQFWACRLKQTQNWQRLREAYFLSHFDFFIISRRRCQSKAR